MSLILLTIRLVAVIGLVEAMLSTSMRLNRLRHSGKHSYIRMTTAITSPEASSDESTNPYLKIEQKWQNYWEENSVFLSKRRQGHKKKYVLDMFPYPSGAGLHVGKCSCILCVCMWVVRCVIMCYALC